MCSSVKVMFMLSVVLISVSIRFLLKKLRCSCLGVLLSVVWIEVLCCLLRVCIIVRLVMLV